MKPDFFRDNPVLIRALQQAQNEKTDALIAASRNDEYTVSEQFKRKMQKLIQAQKKPYYPLIRTPARKVLLSFAAAFLIALSMIFSVSALRLPVIEFFVKVYEKFSTVFFVQSNSETRPPSTIEQIYMPEYVPDGYVLEKQLSIEMDLRRICYFTSEQGNINFQQYTLQSSVFEINTEGIQIKEVLVCKNLGIYYSNLGKNTLVWQNDQYEFILSGAVDQAVLLEMARSLKKK